MIDSLEVWVFGTWLSAGIIWLVCLTIVAVSVAERLERALLQWLDRYGRFRWSAIRLVLTPAHVQVDGCILFVLLDFR